MRLGIDKGDHNVSGSFRDRQSLVQMCQPSRMHQGPAFFQVFDGAVVSMEAASSSLFQEMKQITISISGSTRRMKIALFMTRGGEKERGSRCKHHTDVCVCACD